MKNYEYMDEGNIILVKNFVFNDNSLDHAWKKGRLCLVLHTDDNYKYVIPITSTPLQNKLDSYFEIEENSIEYYKQRYTNEEGRANGKSYFNSGKIRDLKVHGFYNLINVYRLPNFYYDQVGKIDYEEYKKVLEKLKNIKHKELNEVIKDSYTPRR